MKRLTFILFFVLTCHNSCFAKDYFTVKWVDDGDTIVLDNGTKVRYIGINTPEITHGDKKGEFYGKEAREYNQKLVLNKKVYLELDYEKRDRYERLLAYVFLEDETFVNAEIAKEGYAYILPKEQTSKYEDLFLKLQREAMSKKKGIWRNIYENDKDSSYIGNNKSKRFHYHTCSYAKRMSNKNKVLFSKQWDAFWNGFAPCKECIK
ncbi:MAG: thermonuclease family protein [Desulfobacterales bacterium]|nr:thermonuclease family protein [Desulfobacterales bacterium]